jgi:CRISPR-associated endonuclease/helicase Cas3
MPLLAHSARPKRGIPKQEYVKHIRAVEEAARRYARGAAEFWEGDRAAFEEAVSGAARVHDLGKVDEKNQAVLDSNTRDKLPVPHEDAGVKYLLDCEWNQAAALVHGHHAGLQRLVWEFSGRSEYCLRRDPDEERGLMTRHVDERLADYAGLHHALFERLPAKSGDAGSRSGMARRWTGLTWRLALSCLVDADHGDTATHYRNEAPVQPLAGRWGERLAGLDRYVGELGGDNERRARDDIRQKIYDDLRNRSDVHTRFYACDSPVGTGKTTAVMAHLLRAAKVEGRELRHIFVVLPYVNIIKQSVKTYRRALVLAGEDPQRVVAAHHHQADYGSPDARQLATLWDCPVTVTTAVQFFETLASNHPARLRKLHELPGSAIFIDEAHAAIPTFLWPLTWRWLRELTEHWGCHVVLGSGSLARFWEQKQIVDPPERLPEVVSESVRGAAQAAEGQRVRYERGLRAATPSTLVKYVFEGRPGPRVVVLNTVRSAAVFAKACRDAGRTVLHLSTALTPADRDLIVKRAEAMLKGKTEDWALIGTSCIEAGLDFDFRSAIREACPVASMVQIGGRLNRHGIQGDAVVAIVTLDVGAGEFTELAALRTEVRVLEQFFEHADVNKLSPAELCTRAMKKELDARDLGEKSAKLMKAEEKRDFPEVSKLYRVIDEDTVTAVVDEGLAERLARHDKVDPLDLVECSLRIRRTDVRRYSMTPIVEDEIYKWTLAYDPDLLGYMAGVFEVERVQSNDFLGA